MRGPVLTAACLLVLSGLVGCGGDDPSDNTVALTQTTVVPTPTATTPTVSTAMPPTVTEQSTSTTDTDQGDEEAIRVPAVFTVTGGGTGITPAVITVPAFFPVELTVKATGGATKTTFTGSEGPQRTMTLDDGDIQFLRVGSLEPGDYTVRTSAGATATIRSVRGGNVGP